MHQNIGIAYTGSIWRVFYNNKWQYNYTIILKTIKPELIESLPSHCLSVFSLSITEVGIQFKSRLMKYDPRTRIGIDLRIMLPLEK